MAAAPGIEDPGPGSHGISRLSAVAIQLTSYAASCAGERMDRHPDLQYQFTEAIRQVEDFSLALVKLPAED